MMGAAHRQTTCCCATDWRHLAVVLSRYSGKSVGEHKPVLENGLVMKFAVWSSRWQRLTWAQRTARRVLVWMVCLIAAGNGLAVTAAAADARSSPASGSLRVSVVDAHGAALGDVALALVALADEALPAPANNGQIIQQDKRFMPLVTVVQTGTAVTFPNHDTVRHHVYSFSPPKVFELKLYIGTPPTPVVFDKPGVVVMGCNIHDHMVAYVVVSDTPWVAVSDASGEAHFDGVPAGEYVLQYWHPRWVGVAEMASMPLRIEGDQAARLSVGDTP
jgi:plastocyanin